MLLVMPEDYCLYCGGAHSPSERAMCERTRSEAKHFTLSSSRVAGRMLKGVVKEELDVEGDSMLLTERRKQALREIEELELEKEVAELKEKKKKLLAEWERRRQREKARARAPS